MTQTIDRSLLANFHQEARAYFVAVDRLLDRLAANIDDAPALSELHAVAVALQQGSSSVGLEDAAGVAQSVVELAAAIIGGDIPIDAESVDLFREACNGFRDLVNQSEASANGDGSNPQARKKRPRREVKETVRPENVPLELVEGFLIEASENLALIDEKLREFEQDNSRKAALKDARRGVHTIKGASGMVGLWAMSKLALRMEDLLDAVYDDELAWSPEIHLLIGASYDGISDMVARKGSAAGIEARLEKLQQQYDAIEQEQTPSAAAPVFRGDSRIPEDTPIGGDLQDGFVQEASGLLEGIEALLSLIYGDPGRKEVLQEIRRRIHTIKGAAGIVGLKALSNLAHRMEDLLDQLFEGTLVHDAPVHGLLFATTDLIADMVADSGSAAAHTARLSELYGRYESLNDAPAARPALMSESGAAAEPLAAEPSSAEQGDAVRNIRAPIEKLDEMVRLVGELFVARSVFERSLNGYRREIDELGLTLRRLKRIAQQFESEYAIYSTGVRDLHGERRSLLSADRSEFDALEFDRYTQFHLMSRDLLETASDIATAESVLSSLAGEFDASLAKQGRLTADIQNRLMRLRMVPLSTIASRLSRTVRVTSEATGKLVKLALDGFGVELDKTVLEQLASPLEHLLRNAVDHGIEAPEDRGQVDKPEQGSVQVVAGYEGTHVVIRIADDGRGISSEKIRATAVQRGFVSEEEANGLADKDVLEFLFVPGFSTAATLTEISGRGVGLDIVRSAVELLKGTVSIESEPGAGTCFTVRLPMSLSITKVLLVEANQESFAIPLSAVTQVARVDYGQIETYGSKKVIRHERKLLPAIWLGEILRLPKAAVPGARQSMVVIESDGERFGLLVDRIVEARQVMVNPPAGELRKAPVVAGATIMGDGSVVLVLNPVELVSPTPASVQLPRVSARSHSPQRVAFDVLVVDDSLSVRRVVSNLMRATGWNPIQAKDGVEALEILQRSTRKPDIILLDVEMPRMDGYEFATTVKGLSAYRKIPIVMLTSRAGDKHRKKAMAIGVNEYLVKPYQDETLLNAIRQWVACTREGAH